jgi:glycosyltransferase involved in cell wall biosynthesis
MTKVSVIIPAYNEEKYLPETLASVRNALSVISHPSEIILVDNDSNDKTAQIAESYGAMVFRQQEHNISGVRNTGAENSTGDILVFIDADTVVPQKLLRKITEVMQDEKCLGGAVSVQYSGFERKWMKLYLLGWKFWERVFNMKQGAAQFCRKPVFERLHGYDQTVFMGEDVEFYWRLSKFARQNDGYLYFIDEPKVTTSSRRFDRMGLWKILLRTNPILMLMNWRKRSSWSDWYEEAIR